MFAAILRKELLNHLASFRFWVGALLTIVLAASSTLIAARDYSLRLNSYQERVADHAKELQAVSVYSSLQPLVVRAPAPLSVLDQGFDSRQGTEVVIHLFSIPVEATGGHRGNELLTSLPTVDLTTIVSVVLGLLALLLTHDTFNGEREDGMLRALFAAGVTRRTVLAGKFAGGLLTLGFPLALGLLVSLALFRLEVRVAFSPDQWLRIAGLVGTYVAYLSLMLLAGLLVSLLTGSTSRALAVSVLVWFVLTIVIPGSAWAVASDLVRTEEVKRSAQREVEELTAELERTAARELRRDPLRSTFSGHTAMSFASGPHRAVRYRNGSPAYYDSLAKYYRFEVESGIRQAARIFEAQQRYEDRLRSGERLGARLAAISPAFLLDHLSESFSGTSIDEYDRFLEACRRYRLALRDDLERKGAFQTWRWFTDDPPEGSLPWPRYLGLAPEEVDPAGVRPLFSRLSEPGIQARIRRDREAAETDPSRRLRLDDLPRFSYQRANFLAALRRGAPEAGALLTLNALVAAAAWVRFRRYDIG
ncbi:MAG TPA: ABC transporter permease subunit [Thermoanaerobaculia bacterium]|nr:ABC transporter permease subunit [Thermoanaerobaculia bacterium]